MRIKKYKNGNEYLLTPQGMWVRNFTKQFVPYKDINKTINQEDYFLFLQNEIINGKQRYPWIDTENLFHENIVIVSDGFDFKSMHQLLGSLPSNVAIIAVNGALAKWEVTSRNPNYYVVNNPYKECMRYLPTRKSLPRCIASNRTYHKFLSSYSGSKYRYMPVNEEVYCGYKSKEIDYQIDDYRNPICAAISLAYRFRASKILLFCCDDVFKDKRPGAIELENGRWMYEQQGIIHGLIDASLHWLKSNSHMSVEVKDCSSGMLYKNAAYIERDNVLSLFENGVKND
jgi:hypothetical protein